MAIPQGYEEIDDSVPHGYEEIPKGYEEVGAEKAPSASWQDHVLAPADAALDLVAGIPKMIGAGAATVASKIAHPSYSIDELWKAANEVVGGAVPTAGEKFGTKDLPGYKAPMYPVEKYGDVIEGVGDVAGNVTGSKDVAGAVKMAGSFAPIPFVHPAAKSFAKWRDVPEKVSPRMQALRAQQAPAVAQPGAPSVDFDPTQGPGMPPVMQMTPEGQGIMGGDAQWRDMNGNPPKPPIPDTAQETLPFQTSPEEISATQNAGNPQMGMFNQQNPPSSQFDPHAVARQHMELELQKQRFAEAQAQIEARQRDLMQQVARQGALDRGAADRQRLENQPTGYNDWQVNQAGQEAAQTHDFLKDRQQSEINDHPEGYAADQYGGGQDGLRYDENGMPIRADRSMEAQNLENPLQRNLWGDELPRQSEQEAPRGITAAIDRMPNGEARGEALDQLKNGIKVPRGQRGAINVNDVKAAIDYFKKGFASAHDVLASFKGAFSPFELEQMKDALLDPKSRSTVVLMKPDVFHRLAAPRDAEYMHGDFAEDRRQSVRDGLRFNEDGLRDMPYLHIETGKDGVAQVIGHEGRHRMDVFKEMGVDLVPVRIKDVALRWGETPKEQWPSEIRPEGLRTNGANSWMPQPLSASYDSATGKRIVPQSQRGGIPIGDLLDKLRFPKKTDVHDYLHQTVPGLKQEVANSITRPDSSEKIIQDSKNAGGDIDPPGFTNNNFKSGMILESAKYNNHPLLLGLGRWAQYQHKAAQYMISKVVQPLQQNYIRMGASARGDVAELLRDEMYSGKTYTPDQLKDAGFTQRQIDSYQMQRQAFNYAFDLQNKGRVAMSMAELNKIDAYLASSWTGDWHAPIKDANGKLVWYIRTTTRSEANKAIKYLRENHPELAIDDSTKPKFMNTTQGKMGLPRDVMGAYQDMLQYFNNDPQVTAQIKEAMQNYAQQKGYTAMGQHQHFKYKENIRGFQGDRPWLSDKENNDALLKSQIDYLSNAIRWAHVQEAMAETKKVLSDPDLDQQMPNAMNYAKQVTMAEYGIADNLVRPLEQAVARMFGQSTSSLHSGVHNVKEMTYYQLLGASVPYMIATPLQALVNTPAHHMILTGEGFKHNIVKTTTNAMIDSFAAMANHYGEELTGKPTKLLPMTSLGKDGLKYMEDNGIVAKTLFDEHDRIGDHPLAAALKNTLGGTISVPEKIARAFTFMGFAHHLEASGKFAGDRLSLFRRAEELTGMAITDFHSSERPMVVDKLGALGEGAYTFKSFLFNQFNQFGVFARHFANGKPEPLASALGMLVLLGGLQSLPGFQEMDGALNLFKDFMASQYPQHYSKVQDISLRGAVVGHLPEFASYGLVSWLTGAQMSSRFSPGMVDLEKPFSGIAPIYQEAKEWGGMAMAALHLTNTTKLAEAAYQNVPPLAKGQMETRMDVFKGPKQGPNQVALNPNNVNDQRATYVRTPTDEAYRKWGMTSLPEAKTKALNYMANQETDRTKSAMDNNVTEAFSALRRGDKDSMRSYILGYLKLNPDSAALQQEISNKINSYAFTPEQRNAMNATSTEEVMRLARRIQMEK